jgi:hypothetical protein
MRNWYKLIYYWCKVRNRNGLTIPFILGSESLNNSSFLLSENAVKDLLEQIKNSSHKETFILQRCENVGEYVLGMNNEDNPMFGLEVRSNSTQKTTLIATMDTSVLGKSFDEISDSLNRRYNDNLSKKKYSRNDFSWTEYSESDKNTIKQALDYFG